MYARAIIATKETSSKEELIKKIDNKLITLFITLLIYKVKFGSLILKYLIYF